MISVTRPLVVSFTVAVAIATVSACTGGTNASNDPGGPGDIDGPNPGTSACPPDEAFFVEHIWTPIVSVSCISCHTADGAAKNSRMVLHKPDEADFLGKNFAIMSALASEQQDGVANLLSRPSGRHPQGHGGGTILDVNSADYRAMENFVGRVIGDADACEAQADACVAGSPGPRMLRRLSRSEYDNTIRDLFGSFNWDAGKGATFTADTVVNGFDNNASALVVTPLFADQVRQAAEDIASRAVANVATLVPCQAGEACARQFITDFGSKIFRRPVTDTELERYLAIYDLAIADATEGDGNGGGNGDSFATGIELMLSVMLQSPNFLYRSELGQPAPEGTMNGVSAPDIPAGADTVYALTSYEIASELSYFLWGSMPDDELMTAAAAGTLHDPAEIEAQARRMLASPKSEQAVIRFAEQWLGIDQIALTPKDSMIYPEITADIRTAMAEEAGRYITDIALKSGGYYGDLLLSPHTFINGDLAQFYDVPTPMATDSAGYGMVELDGTTRGGLLTLGALMTTHGRPNSSSPVHRGRLVRERLLCQHLPPPPPGVDAQPPPLSADLTTRERYNQHAEDPACSGCHRLMDPVGFGFETLDGIGRYRAEEHGQSVDVTGTVHSIDGTDIDFRGVDGLAEVLAGSAESHACFARQWFRYAYGVADSASLSCLQSDIETAFASGDMPIAELMIALTQTSHFRYRRGSPEEAQPEPTPGDAPGDEPGDGQGGDDQSEELDVQVHTDAQWQSGSCHTVEVGNSGTSEIDWIVTIDIAGNINDYWNAELNPNGDPGGNRATFAGVAWNNLVAPGAAVTFGFCQTF